jgi:lipopolysaccharide/colanic/teichoic acid biosynthesis glycosyltransferase
MREKNSISVLVDSRTAASPRSDASERRQGQRRILTPAPVTRLHTPEVRSDLEWGEPVSSAEPPLVLHRPLYKRPLDIVVAAIIALLILPLLCTIALMVRLSSPGPILFASIRLGRDGKPFRCYKFRSMHEGADERLREVLKNDPELRREFNATAKIKDDPRITRVGSLLRRTSLDELPQLLNVLRGEMSLVGPRPVPAGEALRYGTWLHQVQTVRPGLTGQWQVSGRNDISYEQRARLDYVYSASHTLHGDLAILARTILVVLRPSRSGAY